MLAIAVIREKKAYLQNALETLRHSKMTKYLMKIRFLKYNDVRKCLWEWQSQNGMWTAQCAYVNMRSRLGSRTVRGSESPAGTTLTVPYWGHSALSGGPMGADSTLRRWKILEETIVSVQNRFWFIIPSAMQCNCCSPYIDIALGIESHLEMLLRIRQGVCRL